MTCYWLYISELMDGIEGGGLVHSLKKARKKKIARADDVLVFHFPQYQMEKGSQPATAIIKGRKFYKIKEALRVNPYPVLDE